MSKLLEIFLTTGQFFGRFAVATSHIFVAAVLVWSLLRVYPGDRWLLVRIGNYFAPWLLLGLALSLPVALVARRPWLAGAALVAILLVGGRYSHLLLPKTQTVSAETSASTLTVMTFNVHYSNRDAEKIARLIEDEAPDIIALQEYTPQLAALLSPKLLADYPYQRMDTFGRLSMAVISRYPLASQPTKAAVKRVQHVVVDSPGGPVTLLNIHPAPALGEGGWQFQRTTMTAIRACLEQIDGPLVVLGDFNTTDQSDNYRLVANGLTNVHRAAGRGFGLTFPDPALSARLPGFWQHIWPSTPVVGIDHILTSEHFEPVEAHVHPDGVGSDHRPVIATLRLAR